MERITNWAKRNLWLARIVTIAVALFAVGAVSAFSAHKKAKESTEPFSYRLKITDTGKKEIILRLDLENDELTISDLFDIINKHSDIQTPWLLSPNINTDSDRTRIIKPYVIDPLKRCLAIVLSRDGLDETGFADKIVSAAASVLVNDISSYANSKRVRGDELWELCRGFQQGLESRMQGFTVQEIGSVPSKRRDFIHKLEFVQQKLQLWDKKLSDHRFGRPADAPIRDRVLAEAVGSIASTKNEAKLALSECLSRIEQQLPDSYGQRCGNWVTTVAGVVKIEQMFELAFGPSLGKNWLDFFLYELAITALIAVCSVGIPMFILSHPRAAALISGILWGIWS